MKRTFKRTISILCLVMLFVAVVFPASAFTLPFGLGEIGRKSNRSYSPTAYTFTAKFPGETQTLYFNVYASTSTQVINGTKATFATPSGSDFQRWDYKEAANGNRIFVPFIKPSHCLIRATDEGNMPDAELWYGLNVSNENKEFVWDYGRKGVFVNTHYFPNGISYDTLTMSTAATSGVGGHYAHWDNRSNPALANRQVITLRQYANGSGTALV